MAWISTRIARVSSVVAGTWPRQPSAPDAADTVPGAPEKSTRASQARVVYLFCQLRHDMDIFYSTSSVIRLSKPVASRGLRCHWNLSLPTKPCFSFLGLSGAAQNTNHKLLLKNKRTNIVTKRISSGKVALVATITEASTKPFLERALHAGPHSHEKVISK